MKLHRCWHRFIPGFIHIDLSGMSHIDYKTSIDNLYIIEDESVDLSYSSHSFKYFDRIEVPKVLKEWKIVLKKGEKLRLAVLILTN